MRSRAEIRLELVADDVPAAAERPTGGVARCDEIEPLPEDFEGFRISNPARIVHIVNRGQF